jgi:hypothetical protein
MLVFLVAIPAMADIFRWDVCMTGIYLAFFALNPGIASRSEVEPRMRYALPSWCSAITS